jgi:hypothetical protein
VDLYAIHPDPENAPYRDWAFERVPALVWERYREEPEELRAREPVIARSAKYAYWYATFALGGPFPAGEPAIAASQYSRQYSRYVLGLQGCEAESWPERPSLWRRLKYEINFLLSE